MENPIDEYYKWKLKSEKRAESERWVNLIAQKLKPTPPKVNKEHLRRPAAFCICLLYKAGKYDISKMTKSNLMKFIKLNLPGISAQRILKTLCDYDSRFVDDKPLFSHKNNTWQFRDDNFEYMKQTYPSDFDKGQELFNKLK